MRSIFRILAVAVTALSINSASAQDDTLKIFLLLGQSNMEGQAYSYDNENTDGWNIPTMEFLLSGTPAATVYLNNMPHAFNGSLNASWLVPRDDVWRIRRGQFTLPSRLWAAQILQFRRAINTDGHPVRR